MAEFTVQGRPCLATRRVRSAVAPYCLYLLLVGVLWTAYSHQLNADGVSYLSIGSEYAAGHWGSAVNAYWSPLFSWLLATGIVLKAPPLAVARALLIVFGFLGMLGLHRLLGIFKLEPAIVTGAKIAAAPMFCYFALHDVTPDVLALALLLLYLSLTCTQRMTPAQWCGAGFLGALLYFAKAYCFVFVLAHLVITGVIRIFAIPLYARAGTAMKRRIALHCAAALAMMLLVSTPWMMLISKKADGPTISTAGSYNFSLAVVGPGNHPMLTRGLFAPPNQYAVSIWEDPDEMRLRAPAEPSRARLLLRRLRIIVHNLAEFTRYQLTASAFAPLIFFAFAYGTWKRWRPGERDTPSACLLATYVIYPGAYFLTFVEHRYIWIEDVLLLVMAACVLDSLHRRRLLAARKLAGLGLVTGISFCWTPLFIVVKHRNELHAVRSLLPELRALHMSGNVASNARWDDTQYLAYELGLRYYGMPARGTPSENESALIHNGIRYTFVWHSAGAALPAHPGEKLLGSTLLDVYKLPMG